MSTLVPMAAHGDPAALGQLLDPAVAGLAPRLGPAEYAHVVLEVADHPDQTLVTYSLATHLEY